MKLETGDREMEEGFLVEVRGFLFFEDKWSPLGKKTERKGADPDAGSYGGPSRELDGLNHRVRIEDIQGWQQKERGGPLEKEFSTFIIVGVM